jgi:hypothetical protein
LDLEGSLLSKKYEREPIRDMISVGGIIFF